MCLASEEDITRILQCPNQSITSLRQELLNKMKEWLISTHIYQVITNFLCSGLASWFTSIPFVIEPLLDPNLQIAFQYQLLLGWETLLYSFISGKIVQ